MNSEQIERVLQAMQEPCEPLGAGEEGVRRQFDALAAALRSSAAPEQHDHLSLPEALALAEAQRCAEDWEMPAHLADCPLCLDVFEAVRDGLPGLSRRARKRFRAIGRSGLRSAAGHAWVKPRRLVAAFACAVLVAAALFWVMAPRSVGVRVEHGIVRVADGTALPPGGSAGAGLTAAEGTRIVLENGASVDFQNEVRFSLRRSMGGAVALEMEEGRAQFEVSPQSHERPFIVHTPAGSVQVVGTRFHVEATRERATIYETGPQGTRSHEESVFVAVVTVEEGLVLVKNSAETVRVKSGWRAVLREGQSRIDVQEVVQ